MRITNCEKGRYCAFNKTVCQLFLLTLFLSVSAFSSNAYALTCDDLAVAGDVSPATLSGTATIPFDLFEPTEVISFRTSTTGVLTLEHISGDVADTRGALFQLQDSSGDGSSPDFVPITSNDDGGEGLKFKIQVDSAPAGVYCLEVREFDGNVGGSGEIEIVAPTIEVEVDNSFPPCDDRLQIVGYFDQSVDLHGNYGANRTRASLGRWDVATQGSFKFTQLPVFQTLLFHPVSDSNTVTRIIDASESRQIEPGVYCVYEERLESDAQNTADAAGYAIGYEATSSILTDGFVNFPSGIQSFAENVGEAVIDVTLDSAIRVDVSFDYNIEADDADSIDFDDPNFLTQSFTTLTIPAGELSTSIRVGIVDDTIEESNEQVRIAFETIESSDNISTITMVIVDNDAPDQPNLLPIISTTSLADTIVAGESYVARVRASDPDDEPLTFSLSNGPDWMSINSATGEISGTPSGVGLHTGIEVLVSDASGGQANMTFNVRVLPSAEPQAEPERSSGGGSMTFLGLCLLLLVRLGRWKI